MFAFEFNVRRYKMGNETPIIALTANAMTGRHRWIVLATS
jgi:hypothetical protein